jgi:hypothetical protein
MRELIKKILREEVHSPAGNEYNPSRVVVHKSNPAWRDNIKLTGLQVSVGDCKESIFATDSIDRKYMFDSTYDDDIWLINTECANVTWYQDKHFEGSDYKYHIVTFENISPNYLKLIYKGTGKPNR